jgi:hypothetical protein
MRKLFLAMLILFLMGACGSSKEEKVVAKPTPQPPPAPAPVVEPEPVVEKKLTGIIKVSDDPELNKAVTSMLKGPGKKAMTVFRKRFKDAVPALVNGMKHRRSNIRSNSAQVLVFLHKEKRKKLSKDLVKALSLRLEKDSDKDVRALILKTLAKAKDKRFNDVFVLLLANDPSPDVRSNAAKGLGLNRAKSAESALITALNDEDTWVRMEAATALRKLKSRKSIASLVRLLSDPKPMVRDRVHKALKSITAKNYSADPAAWSSYAK